MKASNEEQGSVLFLVLLMITLLMVIGLLTSQSSTIQTRIAGNDRLHKTTFYEAEGGAQAGIELLEQNIDQKGFTVDANGRCDVGYVAVDTTNSLKFYMNGALDKTARPGRPPANQDATIPRTQNPTVPPVTNLLIGGNPSLSTGGAVQMMAGYQGTGKGAAAGGACVTYDIRSRHQGPDRSECTINIGWRHVM